MKREKLSTEQGRKLLAKRDTSKDLPLNDMLATQLTKAGIPFEREYKFHPVRRWKADFMVTKSFKAARNFWILIDVDGATFSRSKTGHNSGVGIRKSFEKFNEAAIVGYKVLRFDGPMVRDGIALQTIQLALGIGTNKGLRPGHSR